MYIIQFGDYKFPPEQYDLSETQGISKAPASQTLPGVDGAYSVYGLGPSPLAEDSINKSLLILADSPALLDEALLDLRGRLMVSQADPRQGTRALIAIDGNGVEYLSWGECVDVRYTTGVEQLAEDGPQVFTTVDTVFSRPDPVWLVRADALHLGDHLGTFAQAEAGGLTLAGPLYQFAATAETTEVTITVAGRGLIERGLIEISGAVVDPKLTNDRSGHWFEWSATNTATDRLTLDLATLDARRNGVNDYGNLSSGYVQPMVLYPGDNRLILEATGAPDCTVKIYTNRVWL